MALSALRSVTSSSERKILIVPVPQPTHVDEAIALSLALKDLNHTPIVVLPVQFPRRHRLHRLAIESLTYDLPYGEMALGTTEANRFFTEKSMDPALTDQDVLQLESDIISYHCLYMMQDYQLLEKLDKSRATFLLADGYAWNPCNTVLASYLDVPFALWSNTLHPYHLNLPFHRNTPAFGTKLTSPVATFETFYNMWKYFTDATHQFHDEYLLERFLPEYSNWHQFIANAKSFISNRDHILNGPTNEKSSRFLSLPGLTTRAGEPLPKTIDDILTSYPSQDVILLSFGVTFRELPSNILMDFIETFEQLNYIVFLDLKPPHHTTKIPQNIYFNQYNFPVFDLLAHERTSLYVSACDSESTYQSLRHSVPVICFPFMGEHHHIAFALAENNLGKVMNIQTFNASGLQKTIKDVTDDKYGVLANCHKTAETLRKKKPIEDLKSMFKQLFKSKQAPGTGGKASPLWRVFMLEITLILGLFLGVIKVILKLWNQFKNNTTVRKVKKN